MERTTMEVKIENNPYVVSAEIQFYPTMKKCIVCKKKAQSANIELESIEVIDANMQQEVSLGSPIWNCAAHKAELQYVRDLKRIGVIADLCEKFNCQPEDLEEEEIEKQMKLDTGFTCPDCTKTKNSLATA